MPNPDKPETKGVSRKDAKVVKKILTKVCFGFKTKKRF